MPTALTLASAYEAFMKLVPTLNVPNAGAGLAWPVSVQNETLTGGAVRLTVVFRAALVSARAALCCAAMCQAKGRSWVQCPALPIQANQNLQLPLALSYRHPLRALPSSWLHLRPRTPHSQSPLLTPCAPLLSHPCAGAH